MPWYTCLAIVAVVYGIGRIRSPRIQALVYSAPIPISLVLLSTGAIVDSRQLLGVAGLVLFFFVVAAARATLRLPDPAAVLVGIGFYLGWAISIQALPPPSFGILGLLLCGAWVAAVLVMFVCRVAPVDPPLPPPEALSARREIVRLSLLTVATFSMVWLAGLIGTFTVTFPYSGILVSSELGDRLSAFARQFAFRSISLVAFFGAYHVGQGRLDSILCLALGWLAFVSATVGTSLLEWIARRFLNARSSSSPSG